MKSIKNCNQTNTDWKWSVSDGYLSSETFRPNVSGHPTVSSYDIKHRPCINNAVESETSAMTTSNIFQRQGSGNHSTDSELQELEKDSKARHAQCTTYLDQDLSNVRDDFAASSQDGLEYLLQACELLEIKEKQYRAASPSKSGKRTRPSMKLQAVGDMAIASSNSESMVKASEVAAQRIRCPRKSKIGSLSPVRKSSERGVAFSGPCTNPDCEHPFNSPQWRKGPSDHPVLCNACGTRWLRNGTLKALVVCLYNGSILWPLFDLHTADSDYILHPPFFIMLQPKRGIRYGKVRSKSPSKLASMPDRSQIPTEGCDDKNVGMLPGHSYAVQDVPDLSGDTPLATDLERSEQIRLAAVIAATQAAQHILAAGHLPLIGQEYHQGVGDATDKPLDAIQSSLQTAPSKAGDTIPIRDRIVFNIQAVAGGKDES
jgi:hypothetical protein